MIDVDDNNAEYYYHYDGLGSVVALSDSAGDTVQTYEYSVYGRVAAEDPDFLTNPYMFTGRRFDLETGLYYYRARYYNPHIGRFMQTDPVGYDDGINWYVYCGNNPLGRVDPSGMSWYSRHRFLSIDENAQKLKFQYVNASNETATKEFESWSEWQGWAEGHFAGHEDEMAGWELAGWEPGNEKTNNNKLLFWELQKMAFLSRNVFCMLVSIDGLIKSTGQKVTINFTNEGNDKYYYGTNTLRWNYKYRGDVNYFPDAEQKRKWHTAPAMVGLAHELMHCEDDLAGAVYVGVSPEVPAMFMENHMRYGLFKNVPGNQGIYPRPGYDEDEKDLGLTASGAWSYYRKHARTYPRYKIIK